MIKHDIERRMLTQAQAAEYCGVGVKAFKDICPVTATPLRDGLLRYDRYRLDHWLDSLTGGSSAPEPGEWLQKWDASLSNGR